MSKLKLGNPGKRIAAETRVGLSLEEYFKRETTGEKSQGDMARELGVSRVTVVRWLRDLGYRVELVYTKGEA